MLPSPDLNAVTPKNQKVSSAVSMRLKRKKNVILVHILKERRLCFAFDAISEAFNTALSNPNRNHYDIPQL